VVRELGLTQATTHAILTTLCDRGWASRDPVDKTYSLGPALAVVATRVETARPLAHSARTAALQLADEFGYATSVVERFGDSLVITAFKDAGQRPAAHPATGSATPRRSESRSPPGTPTSSSRRGFSAARPPTLCSPVASKKCWPAPVSEDSTWTAPRRL
jgi:hypothetical protein